MSEIPERSSQLFPGEFDARSTQCRVEYQVLAPPDLRAGERLPMILHLHGAMSSAEKSLALARPVYEDAWRRETLPRAVVACATTPTLGGFYIDPVEGAGWETLVGSEFPAVVEERFPVGGTRAVLGSSMGGYGALKLAFRNPERFSAVAALSPAVFPAERADAVPERNLPSVLGELHRAMGVDEADYRRNSVYGIARANLGQIQAAGLGIFLECGDADEFRLHDGAVFLHHFLEACGVPHGFHTVAGAGHLDAAVPRLAHAVDFLGRWLAPR